MNLTRKMKKFMTLFDVIFILIINFITDYPLGKKVVEEIVVGKHAN